MVGKNNMTLKVNLTAAEIDELEIGRFPDSLVDRIIDTVQVKRKVRQPGWYLVATPHADGPRPRWWSGKRWYWGPDHVDGWSGPAVVTADRHAIRLYMEDER